ncbi:hypothetical protein [Hyphobacterium marinum]|uniref:DUF1579 domain-containing protein n=1 Tax=Hyphobacterium marinum TaxID=3116574 RepID=A0ABU7LYV5_9PROT|nr:hypothetical protein [Hyphobacterium sp. Y6023]MEE2566190.1 hypothetical protein [Hyphobacterium sp. Y6023]
MRLAAVLCLLVLVSTPSWSQEQPDDPRPEARAVFEHLSFLQGEWDAENWLARGPNDSETLTFVVTTSSVFDGLGLNSRWVSADSGNWFGTVINTYDPATGTMAVRYFNGNTNRWSLTEQEIELTETGFVTHFSGTDGYGAFEGRTRLERVSDDQYRQTIERKYETTDWFLIDRLEATRR